MSAEAWAIAWQGSAVCALLGCAELLLAALAVGRRLTRSGCAALALGMAVMALAGLLFSPIYLKLPAYVVPLVLLAPALWGLREFAAIIRENRLPVLWGLLGATVTLGSALLPPSSWDELVYQIALPVRYVTEQSAAVRLDNPYSAYPSLTHFFELPLLAWSGLNLPRLLGNALGWIAAASLYGLLRRYGRMTALILTGVFLFSPLALAMNRAAYAEPFALIFVLGFCRLFRRKKGYAAVCCGVLLGALAAVKLTCAGAALALGAVYGWRRRREIGPFIAGAVGAALPFYLRVMSGCHGNPVYPYMAEWFGTSPLVAEFHHALGSFRYGLEWYTALPWGWFFAAWDSRICDGIVLGAAVVGIVILSIAGAWLAFRRGVWRRVKPAAPPFAALFAAYVFWCFTSQQTRFLHPLWPLLLLCAARALRGFRGRERRLALAMLAAVILFALPWPQLRHYAAAWRNLEPARRAPAHFAAYAGRDMEYLAAVNAAGGLPEHAVLGLFFEKRTLYIPRRTRQLTPYFQESLTPIPEDPGAWRRSFAGCDYILVGDVGRDLDRVADLDALWPPVLAQFDDLTGRGVLTELPPAGDNRIFKAVRGTPAVQEP